ncbi:MAG: hypothetical protein A3F10_03805 [Coxiella sp. RIFCSPHIGHO2_12_FULL_42_15]|nr:MAG: hypothetical protein A3F10_03805 [Coxiella sp. RIFCSPHIGHO2_12_FULL_42_15]
MVLLPFYWGCDMIRIRFANSNCNIWSQTSLCERFAFPYVGISLKLHSAFSLNLRRVPPALFFNLLFFMKN